MLILAAPTALAFVLAFVLPMIAELWPKTNL
jgi:hypothetical protein